MRRYVVASVFALISTISFAQSSPDFAAKMVNPKLIKHVEPKFPPNPPTGHYIVTVNFVLDTSGVPTNVKITVQIIRSSMRVLSRLWRNIASRLL